MSVELPEAYILATQMQKELVGKQVSSCTLRNVGKLQDLGFINLYLSDFNRLHGGRIESVASRGNVISAKLDNGMNLLLAPEYGGKVLYTPKGGVLPSKYHLQVEFTDGSALTVTLTGMGIIKALNGEELQDSYVYKRDFSQTPSPINEAEFTFERFSKQFGEKNVNVKSVLVGKDAVVVGLGNSIFQDILYQVGIHPKRKASSLNKNQQQALFNATKSVIQQRIKLGGKNQFVDLYGKPGSYIPAMGPGMGGKNCVACGSSIEKLSLGGGQVCCCPKCQS